MTALKAADIYERALYQGEPIRQPASPTRLRRPVVPALIRVVQDGLWFIGDWVLRFPTPVVRPAPDVQRMTKELRQWTGWSARLLAMVLDTSHTTILALETGRPLMPGHSGDLRRRVEDAHTAVSRIFVLVDRDPSRTAHALDTAPARGISARAHLEHGEPAKAYIAALDVLRPPVEGLLVGSRPARPGRATASLHD